MNLQPVLGRTGVVTAGGLAQFTVGAANAADVKDARDNICENIIVKVDVLVDVV